MPTYLLKLLLPVLLSLVHQFNAVSQRGQDSRRRRLERDRFASEVYATDVRIRASSTGSPQDKLGVLLVVVVVVPSWRVYVGLLEGERVASRPSMLAHGVPSWLQLIMMGRGGSVGF